MRRDPRGLNRPPAAVLSKESSPADDSSLCFAQLIAKAHHRWQIMEATDSSDDITAVVINFKH